MDDQEYEQELDRLNNYADQKLNNVIKGMLTALFSECPENPVRVRYLISS